MIKDAYWFSHDSNARNDNKLLALRLKYDWKGYGLFWAIVEKLREATDYVCVKDYNLIAFDLRVDASIIKSIIEDFGLFVFTDCGKYFYSERLMRSMDKKEEKTKKSQIGAQSRWGYDLKRTKATGCIFYIIEIYSENERFIKCGITSDSVSRRYSGKLNNYSYKLIYQVDLDVNSALEIENAVSEHFTKYTPQIKFAGSLECYNYTDIQEIKDFAMRKNDFAMPIKVKESKVKEKKESVGDKSPARSNLQNTLPERKLEFKNQLKPFVETYGSEMMNKFYSYWTEKNNPGTKMKFELEKTWELPKRLATWASRETGFKKPIEKTNDSQVTMKPL